MYLLSILPLAERDIENAADDYDKKRTGLGTEFLQELRPTLSFIEKNPFASRIRYKSTRMYRTSKRFPYYIHYRITDPPKKVIVIGVYHGHQDPGSWEKRFGEI